jgi:hypothetical protein
MGERLSIGTNLDGAGGAEVGNTVANSSIGRDIIFDRGEGGWLTIGGLSPHEIGRISENVLWIGPSSQGLWSFFPQVGQSLLDLMDEVIHNLSLELDNIVMSGWGAV